MKRILIAACAILMLALGTPLLAGAQARRPPSGGGGGGHTAAAPRSGGGQHATPAPRGGGQHGGATVRSGGGTPPPPPSGQARVRGDRPIYGQAAPRPYSQYPLGHYAPYRYYYYSPWYYYSPYVYGAFGLGYWGGYPGSWGYPYGYGYNYGYGYGYGYNYGYDYPQAYHDYGSIKLKVKPREAEVYVDGYYAGVVDDFDGTFQHLDLETGTHRIEIRADGYRPIQFETRIVPGKTITYENQLEPAGK
jgi:hypothetical protein